MKINKIKINAYGKIKEKEIKLSEKINLIYGKNEAGKTTILNFIKNSFYGISKNKNGKEISDFEKYKPWRGEEFSGKIEYELNNKEKYEIYRDFNKKNPKIFNQQMEEISNKFNIDKNKGNEFFYEQTKVDEALFLSTILVNQQQIELEKPQQNILIQKITNLVGTGEDNTSYKKAIEKISKRLLDEVGTERSREKPINIISKNIQQLEQQKQELEKYETIKYEIEENKNNLNEQIEKLEEENKFLKELKIIYENEKIEKEKINLKINLESQNQEKINLLKNKIEQTKTNNKNNLEKNKKINSEKNKINKKIILIILLIILINILQFIFIKNKLLNYLFLLTVPIALIFIIILKNKINKKEKNIKNKLETINTEIKNIEQEINLLEKNNLEIKNEIKELQNKFNKKINSEKEKIKNKYSNKIEKNKINEITEIKNLNIEIQNYENKINNKKIELHTLELDNKNIQPKLENISKIEEELVNNKEQMVNLKSLEKSINLAKEILNESYEEMKNTITPKFTNALSKTAAKITNNKYTNIKFNDEAGIIVELENGNYIPVSRLSIGTIDQLYLSLRLAMAEELSEEKMPIILDESFAYYDTERLKNIMKHISERFTNHQIIIFTCTNREKEILQELNLKFNYIQI